MPRSEYVLALISFLVLSFLSLFSFFNENLAGSSAQKISMSLENFIERQRKAYLLSCIENTSFYSFLTTSLNTKDYFVVLKGKNSPIYYVYFKKIRCNDVKKYYPQIICLSPKKGKINIAK